MHTGIMKANLFVTLLASPLNVFLQYLLVWSPYAIGARGAPVATSLTYIVIPLLTLAYIRFVEGGEAWGGWDMAEVFDWKKVWVNYFYC
jgi:MATE family multidrug resistance protein